MAGKGKDKLNNATINALQDAHREKSAKNRKRAHHLEAIKRAHSRIEAENFANKTQFNHEQSLATLHTDWDSYKNEYANIFDEVLSEAEINAAKEEFVSTEEIYLDTCAKLHERIATLTQIQANAQPFVATETQQPKMPACIPNSWGHFSGNYAEWTVFRDQYKADMHDRNDVPITLKWSYLRDSLTGDPLSIIGALMHTDDDYDDAWKRLCYQYDDHYMAVHMLIRKIINMPKLQYASPDALRYMSKNVHSCLTQLGNYISTTNWDQILIHCVIDKLDSETLKDWERSRFSIRAQSDAHATNPSEVSEGAVGNQVMLPTWPQMKQFLDQQANIIRNVTQSMLGAEAQPFTGNTTCDQARPNASGQSYANQNRKGQNAQNAQRTSQYVPPCLLCGIKHPIFSCPKWKLMNIEARENCQRSMKLCITCVQPTHGNTPCWGNPIWLKRCPTCWNDAREEIYHNSTLCRRAEAKKLAHAVTLQFPMMPNAEAEPKNQ